MAEHQWRQLKARAQAVAHTGLALNGHALVLEVRHIAVDGAGRDFEPLGQEGGRGQAPPTDELDDLKKAVGAAHGRDRFTVFGCYRLIYKRYQLLNI